MKILLIATFFPPQQAVASLRSHGFASTWAAAGHAVTVLTTAKRPDQRGLELAPAGCTVVELDYRVPRLLERLRAEHRGETTAGPQRFSLLRWLRRRTGIFSAARLPDLSEYWVGPAVAWARAQGHGWDVVVSSSGPPTTHLVARAIRRSGLAGRWVADFRDLWTENHLYAGLFPFTIRERREERACLREADLLVTVSDGLADRLAAASGKRPLVIYNGYDANHGAHPAPAFPVDGRARLVYTGTLYPGGQDAAPLFAALARLGDRAPLLVAAGPSAGLWRALATRHHVAVDVRDQLPLAESLRLQRDATGLLLLDWRDPSQGVLTGKVFEYLKAAAPILVVGGLPDSPLARLVAETGRGVHLGNDVERIVRTLGELAADAPRRPGNRPLIESLSRPRQALRLLAHLEQMQRRRSAA